MVNASSKGFAGLASLVVGTVLLLPGVALETGLLVNLGLVVAAVLLSAGSYLVGTDVNGRAV